MAVALSGFLSFGDKTLGNVLVSDIDYYDYPDKLMARIEQFP